MAATPTTPAKAIPLRSAPETQTGAVLAVVVVQMLLEAGTTGTGVMMADVVHGVVVGSRQVLHAVTVTVTSG